MATVADRIITGAPASRVFAGRLALAHLLPLSLTATCSCLLLFGGPSDPGARLVAIPAVVALLAPLHAPPLPAAGLGLARLVGWCLACSLLSLVLLALLGPPAAAPVRASGAAMALALLVVSHLWLVVLDRESGDGMGGRGTTGLAVVALLAVLGGAPLWMGPLAQAVDGDTRLVNAAVAVSPLSHLAVAMGTDLLRTDWLYRHSSLASLHFGYPSVVSILLVYAVIGAGGLAAARLAHRSRTGAIVDRITQLQGRTNP